MADLDDVGCDERVQNLLATVEKIRFLRERNAAHGTEASAASSSSSAAVVPVDIRKAFYERVLKNRQSVCKLAKKAAKLGRKISSSFSAASPVSALVVTSLAHALLAVCTAESVNTEEDRPEDASEADASQAGCGSLSNYWLATSAHGTALDSGLSAEAVRALEAAAESCAAVAGDADGCMPPWCDLVDWMAQAHGFADMMGAHGMHFLRLRYLRALGTVGASLAGSAPASQRPRLDAMTRAVRLEQVGAEVLTDDETAGRSALAAARQVLADYRARYASAGGKSVDLTADACEIALLTHSQRPGSGGDDDEAAVGEGERLDLLRARLEAQRREEASFAVQQAPTDEQGHATLRSAEANALEALGASTKALEMALQALQVRKRLGRHESASVAEAAEQERKDEEHARRAGVVADDTDDDKRRRYTLLPVVRFDQWPLLRSFFTSCGQLAGMFVRRGQPHKAEYWIVQALSWADGVGAPHLGRAYRRELKRLSARRLRGSRPDETKMDMGYDDDEEEKGDDENGDGIMTLVLGGARPVWMQALGMKDATSLLRDDPSSAHDLFCSSLERMQDHSVSLLRRTDATMVRDVLRGVAFSGAKIPAVQSQKDMVASLAAKAAALSMGWAYELEHEARRRSAAQAEGEEKGAGVDRSVAADVHCRMPRDRAEVVESVDRALASIPSGLRVCTLSWSADVGMVVSRLRGSMLVSESATDSPQDEESVVACHAAGCAGLPRLRSAFDAVVSGSDDSTIHSTVSDGSDGSDGVATAQEEGQRIKGKPLTEAEKQAWWDRRKELDARMQDTLAGLQHDCLGWRCALLLGPVQEESGHAAAADDSRDEGSAHHLARRLQDLADEAEAEFDELSSLASSSSIARTTLLRLVLAAADSLDKRELAQGVHDVLVPSDSDDAAADDDAMRFAQDLADRAKEACLAYVQARWSRLKCADIAAALEGRPDLPRLAGKKKAELVSLAVASDQACGGYLPRGPVVLMLDAHVQRLPWESTPALRHQRTTRMPSLRAIARAYTSGRENAGSSVNNPAGFAVRDVGDGHTTFVVNPGGDLTRTERTFRMAFEGFAEQGVCWSGAFGKGAVPKTVTWCGEQGLAGHDMVVYCGHGSSEAFFKRKSVAEARTRSAVMLMGCSSGKLKDEGVFDAHGMAQAYLMGGAPLVVANLWDVTDKDIDRFCLEALSRIVAVEEGGAKKTTKKKKKKKKTTKKQTTKKHKKGEEEEANQIGVDMLSAVCAARDACHMQWMIGAAPVVYGIPVFARCSRGEF